MRPDYPHLRNLIVRWLAIVVVLAGFIQEVGHSTAQSEDSVASSAATPSNAELKQAHLEGIQLFRDGKVQEAEEAFRRVLQSDPRYIPARYDLAALLTGQGRLREGLAHYEFIALKLLPEDVEARQRFALMLNRVGKTTAAIDQLSKALEIDPKQIKIRRDLVRMLLSRKDLMRAAHVSDAGVRLFPDDASVHNDHGVVLTQLGKSDKAVESFRKAVALDNSHADAHYNMGLALNEQWKLAEAEQELRVALELRPNYTDAHYNLGLVLARQELSKDAQEALNKTIELKPNYFLAYHELGMLAYREEDWRTAIGKFTEALRHQPNFGKSQYYLGLTLLRMGRANLAVPQFEGVLRESPDHADAHHQMGLALIQLNKKEEALAHLQEALWLRPGWEAVSEKIRNLR